MLRKLALTLVLTGALSAPALADTITFKNGHEVHGRLVEETDKYVIFQVGNGKLKFDKKEIATFTEDADYGQRYFTPPKRDTNAENVTPGVDGKPGRTFFVPADATPEERKDLKGVHARIEEELAKLGPSDDERQRRLDLNATERASLETAIANLGKGRSSTADFAALGPKCVGALADALQTGDSATKADAASALVDAIARGDEGDAKWALGRFKIATLLAAVLDAAGDDAAATARNNANHALEVISGTSNGWIDTREASPTDLQRAAATKWKDWAKAQDASWDATAKDRDGARKKLNADWRELDDPKSWRKALARTADIYGTAPTTAKKDDTNPTTTNPDQPPVTNPDVAKSGASPEDLKKIADLKQKIKKTLDSVVGLSLEDRKKKYEPSSEELQNMQQTLAHLEDPRRRAGNEIRQNAIEELVSTYGIKAIGPLSEVLDKEGIVGRRGAATAFGKIAGSDPKEDAAILIRAAHVPEKIVALLDDSSDQRSASVRLEANKALEAISGLGMSYPQDVTEQSPTADEQEARGRWGAWVSKDATDFERSEKAREDHRKVLTELLKKLDSPKSWKDALAAAPGAIAKAERDLKKS